MERATAGSIGPLVLGKLSAIIDLSTAYWYGLCLVLLRYIWMVKR